MRTKIHAAMIGAGGVASYLLPIFLRTMRPASVLLIDKDRLEERNLERQAFDVGQANQRMHKTKALVERFEGWAKFYTIEDWFTEDMALPGETNLLICCADNHEARNATLRKADQNPDGMWVLVTGNEYLDSHVFIYHSSWTGTRLDPRVRFPEITTDKTGSPFRCTSEHALETYPQLALANATAAAHGVGLLYSWLTVLEKMNPMDQRATKPFMPVEILHKLYGTEVISFKGLNS